jgi:hypothetical protein
VTIAAIQKNSLDGPYVRTRYIHKSKHESLLLFNNELVL